MRVFTYEGINPSASSEESRATRAVRFHTGGGLDQLADIGSQGNHDARLASQARPASGEAAKQEAAAQSVPGALRRLARRQARGRRPHTRRRGHGVRRSIAAPSVSGGVAGWRRRGSSAAAPLLPAPRTTPTPRSRRPAMTGQPAAGRDGRAQAEPSTTGATSGPVARTGARTALQAERRCEASRPGPRGVALRSGQQSPREPPPALSWWQSGGRPQGRRPNVPPPAGSEATALGAARCRRSGGGAWWGH